MATLEKICWGLAVVCLGSAAFALVWDWQMAADAATFRSVTTGEIWYAIDPSSLNLLQALVERYLLPELWSAVLLPVMLAPLWLVSVGKAGFLAVIAVLLHMRGQSSSPRASAVKPARKVG